MKVIDLLNKIAKGEEVPVKIEFNDIVFDYRDQFKDYYNLRDDIYFFGYIDISTMLNEEVEVIEDIPKEPIFTLRGTPNCIRKSLGLIPKEDKKIEKLKNLNTDYYAKEVYYATLSKEEICLDIQTLKHKINEMIDKINVEK